jgi:hypothetical protein
VTPGLMLSRPPANRSEMAARPSPFCDTVAGQSENFRYM